MKSQCVLILLYVCRDKIYKHFKIIYVSYSYILFWCFILASLSYDTDFPHSTYMYPQVFLHQWNSYLLLLWTMYKYYLNIWFEIYHVLLLLACSPAKATMIYIYNAYDSDRWKWVRKVQNFYIYKKKGKNGNFVYYYLSYYT